MELLFGSVSIAIFIIGVILFINNLTEAVIQQLNTTFIFEMTLIIIGAIGWYLSMNYYH